MSEQRMHAIVQFVVASQITKLRTAILCKTIQHASQGFVTVAPLPFAFPFKVVFLDEFIEESILFFDCEIFAEIRVDGCEEDENIVGILRSPDRSCHLRRWSTSERETFAMTRLDGTPRWLLFKMITQTFNARAVGNN
jgi:hypothetical protein